MPSPRPLGASLLFLILVAFCLDGCYEPPVRDRMVLSFLESGAIHLAVETIFRQDKDMTDKERDQIRQVVDLYDMGRDPWLRGFERAGARDVAHERRGPEHALEGIVREATLPAVESLSVVMPDAIANFKLVRDESRGSTTLSIVHIDVPASIRDNRRRMEREIGQFSGSLFALSERECDLYDYLARHTDRRPAVLKGLLKPDQVDEILDPEEASLIERFLAAADPLDVFVGLDPNGAVPAIASMSFSAFDEDLCVRLPWEATEIVGFVKREDEKEGKETFTYCMERLDTDDLVNDLGVEADLLADPDALRAASFQCSRYDDEQAVELRVWDRILPRPYYELTWRRPASQAASPPVSE